MTAEDRFEVEGEGKGGTPPKPPVPQPRPTVRRPDATPTGGTPMPRTKLRRPAEKRAARRDAEPRQARRQVEHSEQPEDKGGVFFLFRPGFFLFVGAIVLLLLWAGGLFGGGEGWPWKLFLDANGDFILRWSALHAHVILGAFFVVFFLFTSFGGTRIGRGTAVLTVVGLAFVTRPPGSEGAAYLPYVGAMLLALGAASVISREGARGGEGGRGFLFVMIVLLAASLFFPLGTSAGDGYDAQALRLWNDLMADDADMGAVLSETTNIVVVAQILVLVLAFLAWIGLGGTWSVWGAGLVLYAAVLVPLVLGLLGYEAPEGADGGSCEAMHATLAAGWTVFFLAFALPATAGTIDVAGE